VDLLEDTYEHCRLWCYDHLGIEHESDNGFKAWDFVRTEFLSTIKKLMNLDYNIVLISHEDSRKDVTKKSGDKITAIKPNVNDKVALKVAGMVDIVGRVINDDGERTISFKTNEVIFGGGRLSLKALEIPCEYKDLISVYEGVATVEEPKRKAKPAEKPAEPVENEKGYPADWDDVKEEEPKVEMKQAAENAELKPARVSKTTKADAERAGYGEVETTTNTPATPRRTRRVRGE
jgi:hypothetical protein